MMEPVVSVVIPAYNCESTIESAIFSALNQINVEIELIVVDDFSLDNTYVKVQKLAAKNNKIRLFANDKNLGAAVTRNIGCSYAVGTYIAFLDGDDTWKENKLVKQISKMKAEDAELSFTSYYIIKDHERVNSVIYAVPPHVTFNSLLKENFIGCSTVVLKKELMNDNKFSSEFFHEDYILWLKLLRSGVKAVGVQEALVYYQMGGRSANKFNTAKNRWIVYRVAEKISLIRSIYYMIHYLLRGMLKYSRIRYKILRSTKKDAKK